MKRDNLQIIIRISAVNIKMNILINFIFIGIVTVTAKR